MLRALASPAQQSQEINAAFRSALRTTSATLVIDDYQLLAEHSVAEELVGELADRTGLRLLIGSRIRPSWATARLAIYGDLLELTSDELAFTPDETADVLGEARRSCSATFLDIVDGWPAVIALATLGTPGDAPANATSATVFRFLAEELFRSAPPWLQADLSLVALAPKLSSTVVTRLFGKREREVMKAVVAHGFVTLHDDGHELHPLIRDYLLTRLATHAGEAPDVHLLVLLSIEMEEWEHAVDLLERFDHSDVLDVLISASFKPLIRTGRIVTLERLVALARSRSLAVSSLATLIEAELAFRNGAFSLATSLGIQAAEGLGTEHPLTAHAYWISGQGLQLSSDYLAASACFEVASDLSQSEDDLADSLWGRILTAVYSESPKAADVVTEFDARAGVSPTFRVRAATARLTLLRYSTGFATPPDVSGATHALSEVEDPRVRTAFSNTHAYSLLLRANYLEAECLAEQTLAEAGRYGLQWVVPHAQWTLAACALGRRQFSRADQNLRRAERAADDLGDGHLILNAATLRARLLLSLGRSSEAYRVLLIDEDHQANAAMRSEFFITRGLMAAAIGDLESAKQDVARGQHLTSAVDVRALLASVNAFLYPSRRTARQAFLTANRLGAWDPLLHVLRLTPDLLIELAVRPSYRWRLASLLRRSRDHDLARRAGVEIGPPPRAQRSPLTPREIEIADLMRQGLTNREIAVLLFISEATVKVHVHHILEKLDARSRTEAITRLDT
jgi:ATP/maltotriose-dependent transcriptional regulator MalT